ncbi:uncharacterized protein BYT42DRAFT_574305 [Radiomyces spectabilis]|uniref:uncharacterized protein n=1 Tax=Radiomyces spectabilis TaxID=64574 RepID=UPI002220AD39|nr:uncharacterized protein BYT42DRAFT_574305 [Radiomyces spectabilis]KAI8376355.1 hypothetical protein BYT42DRAFT_574305 [Radiomyces spectabilis]
MATQQTHSDIEKLDHIDDTAIKDDSLASETAAEDLDVATPEPENKNKKTGLLQNPYFCGFLLILAGCAIAVQAGCNATLNRYGGRSFSSVVTFVMAAICCFIFFVVDLSFLGTPRPTSRLKDAPWFAWLGGILGAYYVIINILTVARLGAGTVLSIFVCAQVIMACIIDHFGLVGVAKRRYTLWRMLASLGLIGCVAVIARF